MTSDVLIRHRQATADEYLQLRETIGWPLPDRKSVDTSLAQTLHSVCLESAGNLVAYGRVVGDGGIYFYIQDIIVVPDFRGQGLADIVMIELINYIDKQAPKEAFVGLFSVKGIETFYEKYGFKRRPDDTFGCGMFRMS